MQELSYKMENYLEAIYELSRDGNSARVSDIARKLGVSKASTTSAMASLSEKGLIVAEKYREIYLTPSGLKLAQSTSCKHQVIHQYLTEILHVDPAIADSDACAIEHVISNDSIKAMQKHLSTRTVLPEK
ncbi:metal-dependent transcriptional regulator [Dehalobacter sp. DCM]|uniref:metal-dependent transcriptional regulator n=1 Tax=Dehalobacter sp. DCM TaxID=2907827 RepID=UPI0030819C5A|nr:metal-dependent transcriptional regulator [Dehalobacter sp. DCM]